MAELVRRAAEQVEEEAMSDEDRKLIKRVIGFDRVISTGSTLLDLAISGNRIRGGGVPPGIILEVFGPPGGGKTQLLVEICASAQAREGSVRFLDPEARLDKEYSELMGMSLQENFADYHRPDLVVEMFNDFIWPWEPESPDAVNVVVADSLAALSTELEMGEDGDKMGMKRAKDFSAGLRKTCRLIANNDWILACSNQIRQGQHGEVTPGGKGIPFYASVRIRIAPMPQKSKIERSTTIDFGKKKQVKKIVGIISKCTVIKNTEDDPFREAPVYIMFRYGFDDIRANLQWVKDMSGNVKYDAITREFQALEHAVAHVEEDGVQNILREKVIDMWEEIEEQFKTERKPKVRF
jgi:RecA/RadA recombinase